MRCRWDSVTASRGSPCRPLGRRSLVLAARLPEATPKTVEQRSGSFESGGPQAQLVPDPDHLVAIGPDAHEADRDLDELGDVIEVGAGLRRQVGLAATGAEVGLEARQLLVLGNRRVEDRLVVGEAV